MKVCDALVFVPPPLSESVTLNVAVPLELRSVRYVSVPVTGSMLGAVRKVRPPVVAVCVTWNVSV